MKSLFFSFCFSLITLSSFAQLDVQNASFWNHYDQFNPAMSGLEYKHHAAVTYRNQYPSLAFSTQSVNANYSTKIGTHHGVGINSRYQKNYFSDDFRIALNYNYQFILKEDHLISVGAGIGIDDHSLNSNFYSEYPLFITDRTNLDFTTGVAYTNEKLLIGVGVTRIGNTVLRAKGVDGSYSPFQTKEQLYLNGSYSISISQILELKPQVLIQTNFDYASIDLNLLLTLKKKYWIGGTYYGPRTFAGMIGWDIKEKYRIGYTFHKYSSHLNNGFKAGSHELTIGLLLR